MMRIKWREIAPGNAVPDFGSTFRKRLAEKRNPEVYDASLAAWTLLAELLAEMNNSLPEVKYTAAGKPYFIDSPLHFSISHSGKLAAAMVSDLPCGIDLEMLRPKVSEKLFARCMHPAEADAGLDFFTVWTRKECIAKLTGCGMPGRPNTVNTLEYNGWHSENIRDKEGRSYVLSWFAEESAEA